MGSRTDVRTPPDQGARLEDASNRSELAEGWVAVSGTVYTQSRALGGSLAALSLLSALWWLMPPTPLGDGANVMALLPFVGFFVGLVLYVERPLEGAVSVGHRSVRVVRGGRAKEIAVVRAASYAANGEALVRFETARGRRLSIRCDEAELDRLLRASGLDVLQCRFGASVGAPWWVRMMLAVVAGCVGACVVAMIGLSALAVVIGGIGAMLLGALLTRPSRIEQGIDGVARTGTAAWSLAWPDVASVVIEHSQIAIRASNGATHTAQAATVIPSTIPSRDLNLDLLLLMGRVERAFAQVRSTPRLPESLRSLARNGRAVTLWLDELRALCAADAPFRTVGVDQEQLARALVHPACPADLRFACALILCERWPSHWRPCVREVADACVVAATRRALAAVSDGASRATLLARMSALDT